MNNNLKQGRNFYITMLEGDILRILVGETRKNKWVGLRELIREIEYVIDSGELREHAVNGLSRFNKTIYNGVTYVGNYDETDGWSVIFSW